MPGADVPGSAAVSCIVPAFNSERFIGEALDSILHQSVPPAEVIVVDDGSSDRTADVVCAYAPRVKHIAQATAGPAATRNAGVRAAGMPLIAFLDADDRWHACKLERQLACLEAYPDAGVCVAQAQNFWEQELSREHERLQEHPRAGPIPAYVSGAMLVRREVFDDVGLFDERLWFADAAEWFMRAQTFGIRVHALPDVLLFHRLHRDNISRRLAARSKSEFLGLVRGAIHRRRSD